MEGKAAASRGADAFDPLALTLGSIYASAAATPAAPASPPAPTTVAPPRAAPRRLNNGTALVRTAAVPAPASPPPAPTAAQRAALRSLNNDLALIRAAAAAGAPASPPPPPPVAPHAALHHRLDKGKAAMYAVGSGATSAAPPPPVAPPPRATYSRLDKGKAVMYASASGAHLALPPPPQPPPLVSPRPTYRRRLNIDLAPIYVPSAPPSPPPAPPSTPVTPSSPVAIHPRRCVNRSDDDNADGDAIDDLLVVQVQVPPFPWATERPAQHGTLQSLLRRGVTFVAGRARCKRCGAWKAIAYNLEFKLRELRDFIVANRHAMDDRAPRAWEYPALPDCAACGHRGAMWPEIPDNKLQINWLFLFLGQMLGCCTLEQLKYFCMNNGQHRTGAKNRVLYYSYIEMSNQLLSFD